MRGACLNAQGATFIMSVIPVFMNGTLKSTTLLLCDVIVSGATAMSASCTRERVYALAQTCAYDVLSF